MVSSLILSEIYYLMN